MMPAIAPEAPRVGVMESGLTRICAIEPTRPQAR